MKNEALLRAARALIQSIDLAGTSISMLQVFDPDLLKIFLTLVAAKITVSIIIRMICQR